MEKLLTQENINYYAENGLTDCLRRILPHSIDDINSSPTPLYLAASNGHADCVKLLLDVKGINVNADKPLFIAAQNGHRECVELLLAHPKLDLSTQKDRSGRTALHIAAQNGHVDCLELLLKDIDADVQDRNGCTPLYLA